MPDLAPDPAVDDATAPPSGRTRWVALAVLLLVQFMLILDASAATIALPTIGQELGFTPSGLTWVVDGYVLMAGGLLLLGGRLGDVLGRRRMFVAGVIVFGLASLACGAAQDPAQLVAARFAQGIGEALAAPAALGLIALTFDDPKERARAIGFFGGVAGLGGTAGPVLSGVLVDYASWRWIFLVNIPVVLLALWLVPKVVPARQQVERGGRIDVPSAVGLAGAFTAIVFGAIEAATRGWTSPVVLGSIAGGVLALAAVAAYQTRAAHPLVPLRFFTDRTRLAANLVTVLFYAVFFAQFYFVTLYLQGVLGLTPLQTGLGFVPFGLLIGAGLGLATSLTPRLGIRPVLLAGCLVTAVGIGLFSRISADGSYAADVLPASLVVAFGAGLVLPCVQVGAVNAVTEDDAGLASGVQQALQQVAGAVGLAVLVTLALDRAASAAADGAGRSVATVEGYQLAFLVAVVLLVLAAAATVLVPGRTRPDPATAPASAG